MANHESNLVWKDFTARTATIQKAYERIIDQVIKVLRSLENQRVKTHVRIEDTDDFAHQFLSTIMHLKLSSDMQTISFAVDLELKSYLGSTAYTNLIRSVYRATMSEFTDLNIEDCLQEYQYWYSEYETAMENPYARITTED